MNFSTFNQSVNESINTPWLQWLLHWTYVYTCISCKVKTILCIKWNKESTACM